MNMFSLLKNQFDKFKNRINSKNSIEKRIHKRHKHEFTVACNVHFANVPIIAYSGEEILTRVNNISSRGLCINWPRNWRCLICKNRIDLSSNSICSLDECLFKTCNISIGDVMTLAIQLESKVIENIKGRVIWYKEAKESIMLYDKVGFCFSKPLPHSVIGLENDILIKVS